MGKLTPVSRPELVSRLRRFGFTGPFVGGQHEFMVREQLRLTIPNVHATEIRVDLLMRILRQAGISREDWESTR